MSKYNPLQFERWRQLMLVGALVLLVTTILQAAGVIDGGLPYAIGLGAGYMILAFGFAESFRARRAKQQSDREAKLRTDQEEVDPPVS